MFQPLSGLQRFYPTLSPFFSDLDISLNPTGKIVISAGQTLDPSLQIDASEATMVSWTKVEVFVL